MTELPPLPDPNIEYISGHREPFISYDIDQMQAYGQACREQALLDAMNATRAFGKTGEVIAVMIGALK